MAEFQSAKVTKVGFTSDGYVDAFAERASGGHVEKGRVRG